VSRLHQGSTLSPLLMHHVLYVSCIFEFIILSGGDNSNGAKGNFYEGIMATGYTSDATDDAVQLNIVGVRYKTSSSSLF